VICCRSALAERILLLDGAMGTMIRPSAWARRIPRRALSRLAQGARQQRPARADVLDRRIHAGYLDAGADIISTNTFNATSVWACRLAARPRSLTSPQRSSAKETALEWEERYLRARASLRCPRPDLRVIWLIRST
jgi:5-methyltetrahydrofolate--homocysteine methyltransferase